MWKAQSMISSLRLSNLLEYILWLTSYLSTVNMCIFSVSERGVPHSFAGTQLRMETMSRASQKLKYDAQGRITGIVDRNDNETKYLLDQWGRIIGVRKADGSMEQYAYDYTGNLTSSTDGEGYTTQ